MHNQKIKLTDIRRVMKEITRESDHYQNDVDPERSCFNYQFKAYHNVTRDYTDITKLTGDDMYSCERLSQRAESYIYSLKFRKTKATVGLCNWVITAPDGLEPEEHERFFAFAYKFLVERYGDDSVLPGTVHNDETTPHMHVPCIPIIHETTGDRLNAKEWTHGHPTMRGKNGKCHDIELEQCQEDLDKACEIEFGIPKLILNGKTKYGKVTIAQMKELDEKHKELDTLKTDLQTRYAEINRMITDLEDEKLKEKWNKRLSQLSSPIYYGNDIEVSFSKQ